ncbi:hypothetical protein F2I39_08940 [Escherichia coli]|nr:hypothetical protein [Escherichia coli]
MVKIVAPLHVFIFPKQENPFSGEGVIMFVIPVPLKRNTPFRRSWWTHSHIRKIAFRRGERNSCNPLLMELSAPSNFYIREIKKMRCAGGLFHHWWETWHHINQLDNG